MMLRTVSVGRAPDDNQDFSRSGFQTTFAGSHSSRARTAEISRAATSSIVIANSTRVRRADRPTCAWTLRVRGALPHRLAGTRYSNSTVRVVPEIGIFSGVSNLTTFTGSHDGSG